MSNFHTHARTVVVAVAAFGALAAPAAAKKKPRAAQHTPPAVLTDGTLAGMSAAEQLSVITARTGGGHLAIINGNRYIRVSDGTLVRI